MNFEENDVSQKSKKNKFQLETLTNREIIGEMNWYYLQYFHPALHGDEQFQHGVL